MTVRTSLSIADSEDFSDPILTMKTSLLSRLMHMHICILLAWPYSINCLAFDNALKPFVPIRPGHVTSFRICFGYGVFPQGVKEYIRTAIVDTWERAALIEFNISDSCMGPYDLRIVMLAEPSPHEVPYMLRHPENQTADIKMRELETVVPRAADRPNCYKNLMIHEMGHALGFRHEGQRRDAPPPCQNFTRMNNGGGVRMSLELLTIYDPFSALNYCDKTACARKTQITGLDVLGAQKIYGVRAVESPSLNNFEIGNMLLTAGMILLGTSFSLLLTGVPSAATATVVTQGHTGISPGAAHRCVPKWGACEWENCLYDINGTYVCPECCEDLICVRTPISLSCQFRPPSFGTICHHVQRAASKRFGHPVEGSSHQLILMKENGYQENCPISIKEMPPLFNAVCGEISNAIYDFDNIYNDNFLLSDTESLSNCTIAVVS